MEHTEDPIKTIRGLKFATFLRDKRTFSMAMGAAHDYDAPSEDEGKRDPSGDTSTSGIHRAFGILDAVGMLIQRRELKADRECDRVLGCNMFSDSSPVTGEEFQGMILEVIDRDHNARTNILPGSTLVYGQFNATAKGMCLLFALWCVCGPFFL